MIKLLFYQDSSWSFILLVIIFKLSLKYNSEGKKQSLFETGMFFFLSHLEWFFVFFNDV